MRQVRTSYGLKELSEVTDLVQLAKENRITRKTREPFDLSGRSGPDLVFGASTGLIGGNGNPPQEKRRRFGVVAPGEKNMPGFPVFFFPDPSDAKHPAPRYSQKNEWRG